MLNRPRISLLKLLADIHTARINPFENCTKWRTIQESLIRKIIYIETKIRVKKQEIKEINSLRKNPNDRLSKRESVAAKTRIEDNKSQIKYYRRLIKIYHNLGDAIAFSLLDKYDIKPQTFKEAAGFISEKTGLRKEKQIFRHAFKNGAIAILNDLTFSLRYADITLITESGIGYIEVKSSDNNNERIQRQKVNTEKVFKYLQDDLTDELYGQKMQRRAFKSPEKNYIPTINELIEISKEKGFGYKLVEPGVLYFVSHNDDPSHDEDLSLVFKKTQIERPITFMLNTMKFPGEGYYPFALSISDPSNYLDFLEGDFVILVFIDKRVINPIAEHYKFTQVPCNESRFASCFKNENPDAKISHFNISSHIFNRIALEFVSLDWLFKDAFERFKD